MLFRLMKRAQRIFRIIFNIDLIQKYGNLYIKLPPEHDLPET